METGNKRMLDAEVACIFGVAEAIVLEQVRYWIKKKEENRDEYKNCFRDGKCWVYNSYREWHNQLPFYSEHTIRRALTHLAECGVLIRENYNKLAYDKTIWYTVDEEKVSEYLSEQKACVQNGHTPVQNGQMDVFKMDRPIPKTSTNISSKTSSESNRVGNPVPDTRNDEFSYDILDRQIRKICKDTDREKYTDAIIYFFHKYYCFYEIKMHHSHKRLKDRNIMDAIDKIYEHYMPSDEKEVNMYYHADMTDYFYGNNNFTGNESGECDYSMLHFLSTLQYREWNTEYAE